MKDLLQYCRTPRQTEVLNVYIKEGSAKAAAEALEITMRNVQRTIKRVKEYGVSQGYDPDKGLTVGVSPGMAHAGTSTLFKDGKVVIQWVKTAADRKNQEKLFAAYIEALKDEIPKEAPAIQRNQTIRNLLNCYIISDYHLGSLSWHEETMSDDWDTAIAEEMLVDWFAMAIRMAPDARVGIFAQLGDFLHFDGLAAITPTSGHLLDTDTRFQKVVRVAIRALRRIIHMLLEKHEVVHIIMAEGNHDLAASAWLRELLFALYEDEPRITVDRSASPYYAYQHGKTSLFYHHGHKRKPESVADVFAGQFRELYGCTDHSYAHMGHLHHDKLVENSLMTVEQHRTIAAPDAYASKGGWLSGRGAKVITYDDIFGEVGRIIVSPDMVKIHSKHS